MTTPFSSLDDFVALPRQSGLVLNREGTRLVTSLATLDPKKTAYQTALWEIDPAGEQPARRLTRSSAGESGAAFHASGDLLFTPAPGTPLDTVRRDFGATAGLIENLRIVHPLLAVLTSAYLIWLAASLRRWLPSVGRVAMRGRGAVRAERIISASRSRAISRLRAWLRVSWTWITMAPSVVQRRPASRRRRALTGGGRCGERSASKRSSTALETLLTFCPPGPCARVNCSESSQSAMEMASLIRSMGGRCKPRAGMKRGARVT